MKKIIYIILFLLIIQPIFAQDWIDIKADNSSIIYLNKDSITNFENGAKFDVMYHSKNNNIWMIRNMYLKGDEIGILKTINTDKYVEDDLNFSTENIKFKNCSDTPLKNACNIVINTLGDSLALTNDDEINEPAWGPYMCDLENKIKDNWKPSAKNKQDAAITITIAKDGSLIGQKLIASSNDHDFDASAKEAVRKTAPYRPLPPEYDGNSVSIDFIFDYYKLGKVIKQNL